MPGVPELGSVSAPARVIAPVLAFDPIKSVNALMALRSTAPKIGNWSEIRLKSCFLKHWEL